MVLWDATFTNIISSSTGGAGQQGAAFNGLTPASTYFLFVKVSSEACSSFASGVTLPGSSPALATGAGGTFSLQTASGKATVTVPAGTFTRPVNMVFDAPAALPAGGSAASLIPLGAGISVGTQEGVQPSLPVSLVLPASFPAAAGLDRTTLVIARYDDASGYWAPLPTSPGGGLVSALTSHFSTFQVMQSVAGSTLAAVRVFPNPFRPGRDPTGMSLVNLVPGAAVRIFNLLGEELRELTADNAGTAVWDGRNAWGQNAASGLYLASIETPSERKVVKLAVER